MVNGATAAAGFVSGPPEDLCLGFANTRFWRGTATPTEQLLEPADLLRWCAASAGLDDGTLDRITARWHAEPAAGTAALHHAIALRETLFRIFGDIAAGGHAADADFAEVNRAFAIAPGRSRMARASERTAWVVSGVESELGTLLAPVLWSAGDLLAGPRLPLVRRCANDRCLWLFLDASKGGTRRWCDMSACGNRAKAHRHYQKVRASQQS